MDPEATPLTSNINDVSIVAVKVEESEPPTLPLGVKLTGYRLLGLLFLVAALSKFILSLSGPPRPTATNTLNLVFGGLLAIALWCLGWYENADPPIWRPFFHVDYSRQVIATIIFLARVIITAARWFGYEVAILEFSIALLVRFPGVSSLVLTFLAVVVYLVVFVCADVSLRMFSRSSWYRRASRAWPLSLVDARKTPSSTRLLSQLNHVWGILIRSPGNILEEDPIRVGLATFLPYLVLIPLGSVMVHRAFPIFVFMCTLSDVHNLLIFFVYGKSGIHQPTENSQKGTWKWHIYASSEDASFMI